MSNKDSLEFDFPEAELVKSTELVRDCINIVAGKGVDRKIYKDVSPGRYEDRK